MGRHNWFCSLPTFTLLLLLIFSLKTRGDLFLFAHSRPHMLSPLRVHRARGSLASERRRRAFTRRFCTLADRDVQVYRYVYCRCLTRKYAVCTLYIHTRTHSVYKYNTHTTRHHLFAPYLPRAHIYIII